MRAAAQCAFCAGWMAMCTVWYLTQGRWGFAALWAAAAVWDVAWAAHFAMADERKAVAA